MPSPLTSIPATIPKDADFGFAPPASVGAAQRACLGRGLAFVLMLAASSLASVYVPLACQGPHWVEGTAAPSPDPSR